MKTIFKAILNAFLTIASVYIVLIYLNSFYTYNDVLISIFKASYQLFL